jgi:PAS domain S-box-containing protein
VTPKTRSELAAEVEALRRQVAELTRQGAARPRGDTAPGDADATYGIVAESVADGIVTIDEDSVILFANRAAEKIFGYTAAEMLGNPLTMLMPAPLRPAHRASIRRYLESGRKSVAWDRVEFPGRHKSGREVPLELSFGEFRRDGKHLFIGIVRDVTERKRAEAIARALAEVGHGLAETLDLAQAAGRVVATVLQLFQGRRAVLYELEATSGTLVCVAAAGEGDMAAWIGQRLAVGVGVSGRAVAEGRAVWSPDVLADPRIEMPGWARERLFAEGYRSIVGVPLVARGKVLGALALGAAPGRVFTDAELQLLSAFADQAALALENARLFEESERRRRAAEKLADVGRVLSQSLDPAEVAHRIAESVFVLFDGTVSIVYRREPGAGDLVALAVSGDIDSVFVRGSRMPAGAGLVGLAVRERGPVVTADVLADPRLTFAPPLRAAIEGASYRAALAVPLLVQERVVGALGIGDRVGRVFSAEDIRLAQAFADRAAVALENSQLYAELQMALETVKASQERLIETERLRAVGELASGVAHHLNNLLMVILGRVQLLATKFAEPEARHSMEIVERTALEGAGVIRRLQGFAEVQALSMALAVDVDQIAREAVESARHRWRDEAPAPGHQIPIALDLGGTPPVAGQPAALREVLVSLLLNAADALGDGGRITVRTWAADARVHCSVADTGSGMSDDVRQRAVEPFFTTKGPQRTGLGLSVAHGILRRHGGELAIESREDVGTVVTISLPATAAPGHQP